MPASDLSWTTMSGPRAPIFQVYGTKRKVAPEEPCEYQMSQEQSSAKRRCVNVDMEEEMSSEPQVEVNHNDHLHMDNNNTHTLSDAVWRESSQITANAQTVPLPWQQIPQPAQQPQITDPFSNHEGIQEREIVPSDQNERVMDLCDETYSTAQMEPEFEAACSSMDADCVPDQEQYRKNRSAYCKQYCRVGSVSPASGNVRCYCKPSWEGMIDTRPYISDIY